MLYQPYYKHVYNLDIIGVERILQQYILNTESSEQSISFVGENLGYSTKAV